ncbi:unnamed protein product [Parnassius apollo]|uniref:(apollo) hypothetical protein n=1 Tax=Parnassius apollo TaxID=110799 RepID=A0A8S3XKQ5_PARAO|nr:unnamed protein product [Parnassius apollo]
MLSLPPLHAEAADALSDLPAHTLRHLVKGTHLCLYIPTSAAATRCCRCRRCTPRRPTRSPTCPRTRCGTSSKARTFVYIYLPVQQLRDAVAAAAARRGGRRARRPARAHAAAPRQRHAPLFIYTYQCSSYEMLSLPPLHAEVADALADLPAHTLRHLVKGTHLCLYIPTSAAATRCCRCRRCTPRRPTRSPTCPRTRCGTSSKARTFVYIYLPVQQQRDAVAAAAARRGGRRACRPARAHAAAPRQRHAPLFIYTYQCSSYEMLSLPPLHAEVADALADLPAHTLRHLVKGTHLCLYIPTSAAATRCCRCRRCTPRWPTRMPTCPRTRCGTSSEGTHLCVYIPTSAAATRCCRCRRCTPRWPTRLPTCPRTRCGTSSKARTFVYIYLPVQQLRDAVAAAAARRGGRRARRPARAHAAAPRQRHAPLFIYTYQCSSNEMLSLPPLHAEAADALADLPAHTLRHLVKGRPRRAKTRAPTRPITDQSQDIDEGLDEFWRTCRTPPGSEEASLSGRTPLTSRSLHSLSSLASPSPLRHSPTLQRDDTMYSVTSGESTPVLLECAEVSRCKSSDNVGTRAPGTPPPSRSSDNVNTMGNGWGRAAGKARPWSVAGGNADAAACTTEGVEACVGGSIVGITPGAALTSSMLRDHPLTPEGAEA